MKALLQVLSFSCYLHGKLCSIASLIYDYFIFYCFVTKNPNKPTFFLLSHPSFLLYAILELGEAGEQVYQLIRGVSVIIMDVFLLP
jgi:hypothetical protein